MSTRSLTQIFRPCHRLLAGIGRSRAGRGFWVQSALVVLRPEKPLLWDLIELAVCYGLILAVIWTPRPQQQILFWVALAWITLTTIFRFPGAATLGLTWPRRKESFWTIAVGFGCGAFVVASAIALGSAHRLTGAGSTWLHALGYLLWAFEQQFILQDYFLVRLLRLLPNSRMAVLIAATLFAAAHTPSPILLPITLLWGLISCYLFSLYRDLYSLGIVHGILGLCVAISVPEAITHHMMVGLGYLHYR